MLTGPTLILSMSYKKSGNAYKKVNEGTNLKKLNLFKHQLILSLMYCKSTFICYDFILINLLAVTNLYSDKA